jgi:hypothetical protein
MHTRVLRSALLLCVCADSWRTTTGFIVPLLHNCGLGLNVFDFSNEARYPVRHSQLRTKSQSACLDVVDRFDRLHHNTLSMTCSSKHSNKGGKIGFRAKVRRTVFALTTLISTACLPPKMCHATSQVQQTQQQTQQQIVKPTSESDITVRTSARAFCWC